MWSIALRTRIPRQKGIVRPLDPSDLRSLDHPSHKEKWLELARALGRMDARKDFEIIHGKALGPLIRPIRVIRITPAMMSNGSNWQGLSGARRPMRIGIVCTPGR